jgi:two-component system response regulator YesN
MKPTRRINMLTVFMAEKDNEQLKRVLGLVNWSVYGFDVVGHCGDGITAMEFILRTLPDLVLINDDLPRLSGLELINHIREHGISCDFVIIGDTESFEIAHEAMHFGVEEYLLKPVSREELTRVLKKYAERRQSLNSRDINERFLRTRRLLRNSFMDSFVALSIPEYYPIEHMNQKYHFRFREGVFRSAVIVVKGIEDGENDEFLASVIVDIRTRFDPVCYEMIPHIQGHSRASFIFNYAKDNNVGEMLSELFGIVKGRLKECGYKNAIFCVGIGLPEYDSAKLKRTMETAERAVLCGILRGQNKLYFYEKLKSDKFTSLDILTPTLLGELKSSAEAMDIGRLEYVIRKAFDPISFRTDPAVLIDICRIVIETVADVFRTKEDTGTLASLENKSIFDNLICAARLTDIISDLVSWAQELFSKRLKECEYARPVRDAMRYIEAHCTQTLSLEQVAKQVHLNPSYFSTIFKKETKHNFSDYLVNCRIDEAKRLLRESNLKITQICFAVGYNDNKHFAKIFIKSVGMKPSAYRALHG